MQAVFRIRVEKVYTRLRRLPAEIRDPTGRTCRSPLQKRPGHAHEDAMMAGRNDLAQLLLSIGQMAPCECNRKASV